MNTAELLLRRPDGILKKALYLRLTRTFLYDPQGLYILDQVEIVYEHIVSKTFRAERTVRHFKQELLFHGLLPCTIGC